MSSIIRGSDNFDSLIHQGLGVNQTWQDVTGSRVAGTTYTNSTGKPIFVQVYCFMSVANTTWTITVDGQVRSGLSSTAWSVNSYNTVQAIIPNNSTYSVSASTGTIVLNKWSELR